MTSSPSEAGLLSEAGAPIAVALDAPDLATLHAWAVAVAGIVSTAKVGLEVYCRDGAAAIAAVRAAAPDLRIFLDLKLHDIPATVAGACRAVAPLAPDIVTVHASGGPQMIEAAARALPEARIAAVTVLTSLDSDHLARIGLIGPPDLAVTRLATLAVEAGARAIVCSPHEVARVRSCVPGDVLLITPGVRPVGVGADDQARVATPAEALAAGADLLVIGRPITGAADPGSAARRIAADLGRP